MNRISNFIEEMATALGTVHGPTRPPFRWLMRFLTPTDRAFYAFLAFAAYGGVLVNTQPDAVDAVRRWFPVLALALALLSAFERRSPLDYTFGWRRLVAWLMLHLALMFAGALVSSTGSRETLALAQLLTVGPIATYAYRGHAFANSMDQFSWLKPWMLLMVLAIAQVAFNSGVVVALFAAYTSGKGVGEMARRVQIGVDAHARATGQI